MESLNKLLSLEDDNDRQAALKKAFLPYTSPVEVDGCEEQALIVILNLSHTKPTCKDYRDKSRARAYLCSDKSVNMALGEIQWVHTHNLKYPDSRVKDQRILIQTPQYDTPLGWAHHAGVYPHTIWLLNTFVWQSRETNLLREVERGTAFWIELLETLGLSKQNLQRLQAILEHDLPTSSFPEAVDSYSKQLRFPYEDDYISITPVVSHGMQQQVEWLAREPDSTLRFFSIDLPHPANIGSLCGSLGGHMRLLYSPLGVRSKCGARLVDSRNRTGRYFDDYQLINKCVCSVLAHLCGHNPALTREERAHHRKYQLRILRRQLALWLLPLIELKERCEQGASEQEICDELVQGFVDAQTSDLISLATVLTHRVHYVLQNNKFARRFAYHPKLIQPIKTQLEWVIKKLAATGDATESVASEQYIYLHALRLQDAVAQSSPYLVGLPSLTAFWGFMHRYQLNLIDLLGEQDALTFESFALYVRDEHIQCSAKLAEPNNVVKQREMSAAKRPQTRTEVYTDLVFDMVIRVSGAMPLSDIDKALKAALPTKLAGGALFLPTLDKSTQWFETFNSRSSLYFSLKGVDCSGTWVAPTDIEPCSFQEIEALTTHDQTLVIASNGYRLLESPKLRKGAITDKHAYAENNLGIAKKVNPIEYRMSGQDSFFSNAFWSLSTSSESILIKMDKS